MLHNVNLKSSKCSSNVEKMPQFLLFVMNEEMEFAFNSNLLESPVKLQRFSQHWS